MDGWFWLKCIIVKYYAEKYNFSVLSKSGKVVLFVQEFYKCVKVSESTNENTMCACVWGGSDRKIFFVEGGPLETWSLRGRPRETVKRGTLNPTSTSLGAKPPH